MRLLQLSKAYRNGDPTATVAGIAADALALWLSDVYAERKVPTARGPTTRSGGAFGGRKLFAAARSVSSPR